MDRHGRQGAALLIAGLVVAVLLAGMLFLLGGLTMFSPVLLALVGLFAAVGLGIGALWHARRYGWAWAFLLGVPGFALVALIGFFVLFAIGLG